MRKLNKSLCLFIFTILFFIMPFPCISLAATTPVEEDREKPKPEFSVDGNKIIAKLIPRAKSTSVTIEFEASNGKLNEVKSLEFKTAKIPEADSKDFRSELFRIDIAGVAQGSEITVNISSSFFTKSTEFWIFNEKMKPEWSNSAAENVNLPGKVCKFVIKVKDGGSFDSDGIANGHILIIGGPRDSFWGYVLGTLFIRFFGVFIVLGILMGSMMFVGFVFEKINIKQKEIETEPKIRLSQEASEQTDESKPAESEISPEIAAVIAAALQMHIKSAQALTSDVLNLSTTPQVTGWAQNGRSKIMGDRFLTYNRNH